MDKQTTREHAADLASWGVPGFASGGIVPSGKGGGGGGILGFLNGIIQGLLGSGGVTAAQLTHAFAATLAKGAGGAGGILAKILSAEPKKLVTDMVNWILSQTSGGGGSGGGGGAGGPMPTGSGATVEALMKSMAASLGWVGALWQDLYNVEMAEAGFNIHAVNPSSGAYGLAQGITGPSWYYQWPGGNPATAAGQIIGMLDYIRSRYGSPAGAWAHEQNYRWYDDGGRLRPGVTRVVNATGRDEWVLNPAAVDLLGGPAAVADLNMAARAHHAAGPAATLLPATAIGGQPGRLGSATVNVWPQPFQSEEEIGAIAARKLGMMLS